MDVKTLCLGVLNESAMTGYEIKKHFEQAFSHFFVAGYGSIYPALADLARKGLVVCTDVAQSGRPDKKVYAISPAGQDHLHDALHDEPPRHKIRSEFLVLLYFAEQISQQRLSEIVDERCAELRGLIAHVEPFETMPGAPRAHALVAGLGRVTFRAQLEFLERHRDALLALGSTSTSPAGDPEPV